MLFKPTINSIEQLRYPKGKVRIVLDTDTFNEIDDQFAVTYALLSPDRIKVEAITAAPFYNELSQGPKDGMEKSYEEILRLLDRLGVSAKDFVFKGSENYLRNEVQPIESDAARRMVELALQSSSDNPLYIVGIGAITNVASAILMDPEIINRIVVVWLGGHAYHWPDTKEFNLHQDLHAARIIFDSGVPVVQIPCLGVASHLLTTLPEMEEQVNGFGKIGDYLYQVYKNCSQDHFGYSRVIWDISAIAYLINEAWVPTHFVHSPILTSESTWSFDASRHFIKAATFVHRDLIFRDFFQKIQNNPLA